MGVISPRKQEESDEKDQILKIKGWGFIYRTFISVSMVTSEIILIVSNIGKMICHPDRIGSLAAQGGQDSVRQIGSLA